MEIVIGKKSGFCGGVEFTIKKATEILERNKEVYCLGEIVHNEQVIEMLEKKGMKTVSKIEEIPDLSEVIFRAHGEAPESYIKAKSKKLIINDLTCINVKKIHEKVEKAKENGFVIIVGVKKHPEVIGTQGFAGENSYVIESEDDILDAYMKYEQTMMKNVYVFAQTTFSSKKFDDIFNEIEKNFCEANVVKDKTICNATEDRQLETSKMAKENDIMLIIGGSHSSNTKKLYEVSQKECKKTYFIQVADDLANIDFTNAQNIGIMAGASTPKFIVEDIKNKLENM